MAGSGNEEGGRASNQVTGAVVVPLSEKGRRGGKSALGPPRPLMINHLINTDTYISQKLQN